MNIHSIFSSFPLQIKPQKYCHTYIPHTRLWFLQDEFSEDVQMGQCWIHLLQVDSHVYQKSRNLITTLHCISVNTTVWEILFRCLWAIWMCLFVCFCEMPLSQCDQCFVCQSVRRPGKTYTLTHSLPLLFPPNLLLFYWFCLLHIVPHKIFYCTCWNISTIFFIISEFEQLWGLEMSSKY